MHAECFTELKKVKKNSWFRIWNVYSIQIGRGIIRQRMWYDILVRQHYKVVITSYVTSKRRPDMT